MIDINNIMIGDFFTFKEDNTAIIEITGIICYDTVYGLINHSEASDEIDAEELAPIPITPEILQKNNFHLNYDEHGKLLTAYIMDIEKYLIVYNFDFNAIKISSFNSKYGNFNKLYTLYIHQLQNILKLCDIEEKIILA